MCLLRVSAIKVLIINFIFRKHSGPVSADETDVNAYTVYRLVKGAYISRRASETRVIYVRRRQLVHGCAFLTLCYLKIHKEGSFCKKTDGGGSVICNRASWDESLYRISD